MRLPRSIKPTRSMYQIESLEQRVLLAISYGVIDLGALPRLSGTHRVSSASAINEAGQVAGVSTAGPSGGLAVIFDHGVRRLPLLGVETLANGINNNGEVVGRFFYGGDPKIQHAFLSSGGETLDLGSLGGPGGFSSATAINTAGTIVGDSDLRTGGSVAMKYSAGVMQALPPLPGGAAFGYATAINEAGVIVGTARHSGGSLHAVRWTSSGVKDLGALPGSNYSAATDINDSDVIIGTSTDGSGVRSFIYVGGQMKELTHLRGSIFTVAAINNSVAIVGQSREPDDIGPIATLTTGASASSGGTTVDLNKLIDPASGWKLQTATGINDKGEISGTGINARGEQRAFLLKPLAGSGSVNVTNTLDSGAGSLRAAIVHANAHPGTTIKFRIPAGNLSGGVATIKPLTPLPTITADSTTIDGTTQTAFTGNTNTAGPEVVLNGSAFLGGNGVAITSAFSKVRGLVIAGSISVFC